MATVTDFYNEQWGSSEGIAQYNRILLMLSLAIECSYRYVGDVRGKRVLDLGCGFGQQTFYFAQRGAEVWAVDISLECLEYITTEADRQHIKRIRVVAKSAESLDFAEQSFDVIYINSLLMHVDAMTVLQDCYRLLAPSGKVVVIEPMKYNVMMLVRLFSSYRKMKPKYMTFRRFEKCGKYFSSVRHSEFYFFSLLSLPLFYVFSAENAGRVSRVLERVDRGVFFVFPFLRKLSWASVWEFGK